MVKEDLIEVLGFEPKTGGSYIFEKECFYRPSWISGMYITSSRIMWHPKDNWIKIEYMLEAEYEKFFEGSIETKEDFKTLLKLISYE